MLARLVRNQQVGGSIPLAGSSNSLHMKQQRIINLGAAMRIIHFARACLELPAPGPQCGTIRHKFYSKFLP